MMRFKHLLVLILLICTLFSLWGCQSSAQVEPVILKVSYPSVQQFYRDYGFGFEKKYPHIQIQVVPYDWEAADPGKDADIRYMQLMSDYKQQIVDGKLLSLASRFQQDRDEELLKISPIMATLLKSVADNGELYGVSPTFEGIGLFYNKDLFTKYGVALPTEGLSWKGIYTLSMRFPKETADGKPLYGLQFDNNPRTVMKYLMEAGRTEGLSYIQPQSLQVTINTDRWQALLKDAIEAFRSGSFFAENDAGNPPFLTGQAAMTIGNLGSAYNYEQFAKMEVADAINWGLTTPPIDPGQPERSRGYSIHEIFGISADSTHPEEAWKLLKFMISDAENTRYMTNYQNRGIPVVTEFTQPIPGKDDLSPLYRLEANPDNPDPYLWLDHEIVNAFHDTAQPIIEAAIQGDMTIEEALAEIELKGQQAIDAKKQ